MLCARLSDGRFILGLDAENIRRLKKGQPIMVDLFDHGGKDTVIIMYGVTKAAMLKELQNATGPLPPAQPMPPKKGVPS